LRLVFRSSKVYCSHDPGLLIGYFPVALFLSRGNEAGNIQY
jgi:hypothetical protein